LEAYTVQPHSSGKGQEVAGGKCGCFYGILDEFRKKVEETHGKSRKGKAYQMLADLMEYRFSHEKN